MVSISKSPRGRLQNNVEGGGDRVWCSYHKTTSHNDADCRVQQHKAGGNAHVTTARTKRIKRVCSAYDLPDEDDYRRPLHHLYVNRGAKQGKASNGAQAEERHLAVWSTDSDLPLAGA